MTKVDLPYHSVPHKQLFQLMILLVAGLILYRQFIPLINLIRDFPLNDFSVYLDGVGTTVAGRNPYTQWFFDRYNYSPAATLIFWPFIKLPINVAEFIFTGLSIASLWFTLTLIQHSIKVKLHRATKLLLFALLLKTFPVKLTLVLGQINLIILFLIVASFYFWHKKNSRFAGVLLGVSTVLKLTPLPLILFFVVRKDWRLVSWFIVTLVSGLVAGSVIFGLPLTSYYYTTVVPRLLSEVTPATVRTDYMNQGITALLGRFNIFGTPSVLIRYAVSLIAIAVLSLKSSRASSVFHHLKLFSLFICSVLIFLPLFVWQHHFVFLLPAWLLLAIGSLKRPRSWMTPAAILSYLLINLYFKDPNLPVQQHPLITTHFLLASFFIFIATFNLPQNLLDSKQK